MATQNKNLSWAHPLVQTWFLGKFGGATEPQIQGWPAILTDRTTLISAPTGSGKTLAAFLVCINSLIVKATDNKLSDETEVIYVSPLKALGNDIQKNLLLPLSEMTALGKTQGVDLTEIRIGVRTGDTLMRERQSMLKKPPHILITTPESLYILLTAQKSREMLKTVKTVIVDEIHAMVNSKRGAHLALSLERLEALALTPFNRIGLSATQKPLETVAKFLAGSNKTKPLIINIGHARQLELNIEIPKSELGSVASNEIWDEIYDRLSEVILQNRSTLVFVNTRRLSERIAHHLTERLGEKFVASHHGSLSRKLRLEAETKLKKGELKVLVATASLELGIDIGFIDLVCHIGSPRAIATGLQRIGRAGHWHGAISKGLFFATTRDELLECAALIYAIRSGELDELVMPEEPLDILAQQIVACCATQDWQESVLYKLVKSAYPYQKLTKNVFNAIIHLLADGVAGSRGRYGTYLFQDQVNGMVKARRNARLTAITSGGAIPDNGLFTVVAEPSNTTVGTLDEDFAVESNRGDIILLGSTSWQIQRIESTSGRVLVTDAHGAPPSIPFWRGEAPERSKELSFYVSLLRQKINDMLSVKNRCIKWLTETCGLNELAASVLANYVEQGIAVLGAVPTQNTIIAERFFDESGGMQLVIHAPFGARINKAWGLALRKRFCRSFNFELQAAATDDGLIISLTQQQCFPLGDVFHFLHPNSIKEILVQAVLQSPLFKIRWRWTATRSLSVVRFRNGKKIPPNIIRMLAEDLLAAVFPDAAACQDNLAGKDIILPQHPFIDETIKDSLNEALNLQGLIELLEKILNKNIRCLAVETPLPSPFSHEILNANPYAFLDDAPLEERRTRAVELRRVLPDTLLEEIGQLDTKAIEEVQNQAWPDVRNEDELHDALQTWIAFPASKATCEWESFFENLKKKGRCAKATIKKNEFWYAVEKAKSFKAIYPNAILNEGGDYEQNVISYEQALEGMIKGWMQHLGPTTHLELSQLLQINEKDLEMIFLKLEAQGLILRGHFKNAPGNPLEWCDRRLLSRIHRLTLYTLRKEIEPVTRDQFIHWLLKWQHLAPGTQLKTKAGLLEIIRQLQGFEMPARSWEKQIFAKRILDYDKNMLDDLCQSGIVSWGRLSAHPLILNPSKEKRINPSSIAPITFFIREEAAWLKKNNRMSEEKNLVGLGHTAKLIYTYLKQNGASFLNDLVRGTGKLQSEVEYGLWELIAGGIITADSFDNLRSLIDPKRRLDRSRRKFHLKFSTSRWALLHNENTDNQVESIEASCWMLLKRYGIVFRDLISREKNIPRWRDLLVAFRRLEAKGEIRGGRFVQGFMGEQFALPYAIESLRAIKNQPLSAEKIMVAAVDPLNLVGVILPGDRVNYLSKSIVILYDGTENAR